MYMVWTKHIKDTAEKEQFEKSIMNSKWVLDRQSEILNDMEKDLDRTESSPKMYDTPNWDYRQAHNNGYRQCLQLIKKLITLDQKEPNDPAK